MEIKLERYDAYKNSGVEWLGEIPKHWEVFSLKNVGLVKNGATPSSANSKYWDGDLVWVTPTDINNIITITDSERKITNLGYRSCGTTLVPEGSIILTTRAPIGKVVIAGVDLCTNQGCKSIIVNNGTYSKFLYYLFLISYKILNGLGTGTTFLELSNKELKNFIVPNPPLKEQTAIAQFLDDKTQKIDQAIRVKQEQIVLLKERRQVLIHQAVTRGLDKTVKLKDSGVDWIGEIPEHWVLTKAKYYSKVFVPERSKPELNIGKEGLPWITTDNIRNQELSANDVMYYVSDFERKKTGSRIIRAESVIATCVGNFGIAKKIGFDCIINQQLQGFINLKIDADYLTSLISISEDYFKNNSTLTTIMYVSKDTFGALPIPLPNQKEQREIVTYIEFISLKTTTAISLKEKEIEKLKEYKASLINSVVTGKVMVN